MNELRKTLKLRDENILGVTSSSQYTAEGGSPTFDKVPFRVHPGKLSSINTFVLIENSTNPNGAYYGRIIAGSEINLRANPAEMQRDMAYGMSRVDIRSSEYSPDLVRIMEVEILGEIVVQSEDSLVVNEPMTLPQTGQLVFELPATAIPELLGIPFPDNSGNVHGLYIGDLNSGGQKTGFILPNRAVARHIAILGKTGVGKSYAAGILIEELHKKGIPVLSFDVLGDMELTAQELNGQHLVAGTREFQIPYSIIGLEEFLPFISSLTSDQAELIAPAYAQVFDAGTSALDSGKPPHNPFTQLYDNIREIGEASKSRATTNAIARTRSSLERSTLLTDLPTQWHELIIKNLFTNIYVGHLGQRQRNLVVGSVSRILQRLRRRAMLPPFVLVIDEAHLFLPGGGDSSPSINVVRELIRTARHDAIGIVLLSQSPSSIDRQVLLTCNTRFIFALDPEDLRVVAGQLGDLPDETIARIPRMARGRAVITSAADILKHPAVVDIRERTITSHVANTPDLAEEVRYWRQRNLGESTDDQ